jgi:hypothetical protein
VSSVAATIPPVVGANGYPEPGRGRGVASGEADGGEGEEPTLAPDTERGGEE